MKKWLVILLIFCTVLVLASCNTITEQEVPTPINDVIEEEIKEDAEKTDNNIDVQTKIIEIEGIRFHYPAYFDTEYEETRIETSVFSVKPSYCEGQETFLCFFIDFDDISKVEVFSKKQDFINQTIDSMVKVSCEYISHEDIVNSQLSGWIMNFYKPGVDGERIILARIYNNHKLICVYLEYNYTEADKHYYLEDFYNMINTAEIIESDKETQVQEAFENYGKSMYLYGIEFHWENDASIEEKEKDIWNICVDGTVVNKDNSIYEAVIQGTVDLNQGKVTEFTVTPK